MSNRFSYVKYGEIAMVLQLKFKEKFEEIEELGKALAPGRAQSLFLTKLEEAYMWTGKAIRDQQIAATGKVDEQPARNNE